APGSDTFCGESVTQPTQDTIDMVTSIPAALFWPVPDHDADYSCRPDRAARASLWPGKLRPERGTALAKRKRSILNGRYLNEGPARNGRPLRSPHAQVEPAHEAVHL